MKQVFFFLIAVFFTLNLTAQQNRYIYIQTENKQPFYVKLDKKVFSSSSSGYVIIPKLRDSSYALALGFPKNEWTEQYVTVKIDKKDEGYIFKNFGNKGWGLFNMQTLAVIMSGSKPAQQISASQNNSDGFSNALSNVVNDPAILQNEPAKVEPAKPAITKINSTSNEQGKEIVYTDINNGKVDTVKVMIPAAVSQSTAKQIAEQVKPASSKPIMINSDCKSNATEDDFIKLRKKMIAEDSDDDMVTIARKTFKTKCFTTEQVKNLAVLFLKDEGRYMLFDAAYPFTSDSGNFNSLQSMLTEEYYINRFKALITKR